MDYETLCDYLERKIGARRDMPFGVNTLVFKVLDKIFALVAWQSEPLSISLKVDPIEGMFLCRQYEAIVPGYHLNKKHWITVTLNGSVPDEALRAMMDDSYTLVIKGMTRNAKSKLRKMGWQEDGKETG